MHYVYILISAKFPERIYIGITKDLKSRLERHNKGQEEYTKAYIPWRVHTYIAFSEKDRAYQFEKYLKHGSGHAFLKRHLL